MIATILTTCTLVAPWGLTRPVARDETIEFFPTYAYQADDGAHWILNVHGWVYDPETNSLVRRAILALLEKALDIDEKGEAQRRTFALRVRRFLVDSEGRKLVPIRIGEKVFTPPPSKSDGHLEGQAQLSDPELRALVKREDGEDGWIHYEAVLRSGDPRTFAGKILPIDGKGVSVLSDIDDTIKATNVLDKKEMLVNTFLNDFQAVPGMAQLYRTWADKGAVFHYVSESPWQLGDDLQEFLRRERFPDGTIHLRLVRLSPRSIEDLHDRVLKTKREHIDAIFKHFPQRRFILVGDSTQQDPEIYGDAARRYGNQVLAIYIRNVTGEPRDGPRFQKAFEALPKNLWQLFSEAKDVNPDFPGKP